MMGERGRITEDGGWNTEANGRRMTITTISESN